ncbi:MAG: type II secretion system ATPase GspE [Nitrospirota bacterium]|nr:MAG: type II secretion system ATPase GspE [Nitrospirota bacterium]
MRNINSIRDEEVDLNLLKDIPLEFCRANLVLPIKLDNGDLVGAVSGRNGIFALKELAIRYSSEPLPLMVGSELLSQAISRLYGQVGSAEEVMQHIAGEDLSSVATEFERPKDLLELTEEAPIIRLLNALLQQAVKERASDIHIEPYEGELDVRLRVDGILDTIIRPPKIIQDALISRIKIMSNLDIAEKRLPQDGRIGVLVGGKEIDIRVSIVPTVFGERAVLRILDKKQGLLGLSDLGISDEQKQKFEKMLSRPNGIVLVTGPTGSGKTTTLYASLGSIYTVEKNIITVEDPVEYQLKGIGQIQVNPKIGLTFASGLRSILRQDPDVIMVGEIRDAETADIAIHASLTGHLVLSTLHTNDAASAIARLLDMDIEPFLAATSLSCILAQRLVRTICPHCKVEYVPDSGEQKFFSEIPDKLYRGEGCERCKGSGYAGRTGIFELLIVDDDLRSMVSRKVDTGTIKAEAIKKGMRTLYVDGISKVVSGTTTLSEILRVTQQDHADI